MENVIEISQHQKDILNQFRLELKNVLSPDHTDDILIKFLRARNFNLKNAKKIFMDNYYNRITFGINTILSTYEKPEVAQKYEALGFLGFTKDGSLIRYYAYGHVDFYGFIMSMSCLELCLYFSHMMESDLQTMKEENLRTGRCVKEITYIFDLEGFSIQQVLHQNVIEMGLDFSRLIQDCYPEIWRRVLIINTPSVFTNAFKLFKPVLRSALLDKLKVVDKASTKELLLEYIDDDVLPAFLGGKRVDSYGDPQCKEFISFGGKIPESYYSHNRVTLLSPNDPSVICCTIPPRSVYNFPQIIEKEGSLVKLQCRAENGSLLLRIFYKEIGTDIKNIELPAPDECIDENDDNCKYKMVSVAIRSQLHCCQEEASLSIPWRGLYIMQFSNANSWFSSRKLFIKWAIFPPDSESSS